MSIRMKAQQFGAKLSSMVIPNLGAFLAWGIITAIAIAISSDDLKLFIVPMLNYMLPILIACAAGKMIYGYRGSVVAVVATMGVIVASETTMFLGAMIISPFAAWVLKKFDALIDGKIPVGFELLINNFSSGIIGAAIAIASFYLVAPVILSLTVIMAAGVDFLMKYQMLPLTAIFIEPAKILFLNNAIGQGILTPLGSTQLAEAGKSILFLLESNPGPGLGILLAYALVGKGDSKASASGAVLIHFFGGIHEIYFPFVLMNPILILPLIAGGVVGTFIFTLFNVGLVGVASPGSIIAIEMMAAQGDHLPILVGVLAAAAVSFVVAVPFIKKAAYSDEKLQDAAQEMEQLKGKKSRISSVFESNSSVIDYKMIKKIAYACDAGLGSSAMGASVLQKKIKAAGIDDIKVFHVAIPDLPTACDLIVTHESLAERVGKIQPEVKVIAIKDYLNAPEYGELVTKLRASKIEKEE